MMCYSLFVVITLILNRRAARAGVYLLYNGKVVPNHGIILFANAIDTEVNCLTDSTQEDIGTWYYPNGTTVSSSYDDPQFYQARGSAVVSLWRGVEGPVYHGIYHCDMPDKDGFIYSLYIGLYDENGAPEIMGTLEYNTLTTEDASTHVFTVTCTSTGGPATTVTWTRDCALVPNDVNHLQSQMLLDGETGTYQSTMTVTGPDYGTYECIVTNSKGSAAASYTVTEDGMPPSESTPCVWLAFDSKVVRTHGIVIREQIGMDDQTALQCWSDSDLAQLLWYFPNGTQVPSLPIGAEDYGFDVYQRNDTSVVYLQRKGDHLASDGIYSCVMTEQSGKSQTLFVGIYATSPTTAGTPIIVDGIQIETIPNSVTTLTCTTTGGPAAAILWTRNCVQVPSDIYNSSTVLLDTENATYISMLTIVGDLTGEYRCIVTNDKGTAVANYSSSGHLETSIWLTFRGQVLTNNSILTLEDVGEEEDSLLCWTDRQDCCHSMYTEGGALGKWYFPDGSPIKYSASYELSGRTRPLYRTRGHQVLSLHRRRGGEDGVYYCEIPDELGKMHRLYVGMYSAASGSGIPMVIGKMQFELLTQEHGGIPTFTLTCTSTGGPPTNITWSRDGTDLVTDEDHVSVLVAVDTRTATYYNTLTVVGRYEGLYECYVSNDRGSLSGPEVFLVRGPKTPEILSAVTISSTTVNISWSEQPDNHSDYRVINHYELKAIPMEGSCDGIGDITATVDGTTTNYILSGLEENTTYSVTVTAVSGLGQSNTSTETEVTTLPTVPSAAPEFLQRNETSMSVLVQWRNVSCVELNSDPAGYIIHYGSESGDWNTINTGGSITALNITGLTPYSNYSIKVAVVNSLGDIGPYSSPISVQTFEDIPGAVEFLVPDIQVTAVTLTWSPPRHPNGVILVYELLVEYDVPENTTAVNVTATSYQLTGLDPQQNYTIQVRAYTSVGPGASKMVEFTPLEIASVRNVKAEVINSSTVLVLWDPLELPGVKVLNYTVFYTPIVLHLQRDTKWDADARGDLLHVFPANVTYGFVSNLVSNHSYQFHVVATMDIGGDVFVGDRTGSNESIANIRLVADAVSPMLSTSTVCLTVGSLSAIVSTIFVVVLLVVIVVVAVAVVVVHISLSTKRRNLYLAKNEEQQELASQQSQL